MWKGLLPAPKGEAVLGSLRTRRRGDCIPDDIGDMPVDMQVKLLRVLQLGKVYRVGQHKPISCGDSLRVCRQLFRPEDEVDRGNFREDLFYCLNVFPIEILLCGERMVDVALRNTFSEGYVAKP